MDEFAHVSSGAVYTRTEFEDVLRHAFKGQQTGDMMIATSPTQLSRKAIGTANQLLRVDAGGTTPEWASTLSGLTLASPVITTPDINGGTVDAITSLTVANNVDIGNFNIRALSGTFDSLTSGRVPFASTNGLLIDDADFTFATDTLTVTKIGAFEATGAINFANQNMTNVDIDSGTIDGCDVTVGAGKTLDVSAGTLTLAADQISGDKVEGGTIAAITITSLTLGSVDGFTVTGAIDISPAAAADYHLRIAGSDMLNANEQAIYVNFPLETFAANGIWITLGSRVTSGDLTGIRSRVTGNAASSGANVRGAYLEAKVGSGGKFAAQLEGALIHADYSAGSATISGDVRGLTVQISQGTGLTAANLYGILLNIQTRGNEAITTDDVGLLIRNEAVGGNGRQMDSAIKIAGLNMGGGVIPFLVDITFQNGATLVDDGTNLTFAGSTVVLTSPQINGTIATTGLTLPAITLGGAVAGGGNVLTGIGKLTFDDAYTGVALGVNNKWLGLWGGLGTTAGNQAVIYIYGADAGAAGQILVNTPNAAKNVSVTRLTISGVVATAVATWTSVYHVGLKFGLAGTATGAFTMDGATSGVVTVTVNAVAGTWTMTLPAAVGTAGYFLVDAAGNGVTSWSNTLPAVTLGGSITGAAQTITGLGNTQINDGSNVGNLFIGGNNTTISSTAWGTQVTGIQVDQMDTSAPIMQFLATGGVAHGMTTLAGTSVYGFFRIASLNTGGFTFQGLTEAAHQAVILMGTAGAAPDTTKSTAGRAVIEYQTFKKSGTSHVATTGADNIFGIGAAGVLQFLFGANGNYWATGDVSITNATLRSGSLFIAELANAQADVAGQGQFWVKNLQGAVPMFTGDTGLDASINRTIFTGTADHINNNSTAEQTLIPTGVGTVTIPANTLAVGNTIRVQCMGYYGSKASAPGTLIIKLKIGGVVITTVTHTLDANLGNDEYWEFNALVTVRSIGSSGTVMAQGNWEHSSDSPTNDEWHEGCEPNSSTATINTEGSLAIDLTDQFSAADNANTITLTNITVEILN